MELLTQSTAVPADLVRTLRGNGNAAVYFAHHVSLSRSEAGPDGWYTVTRKEIRDGCGLASSAQRSAEELLVRLGWMETKRGGVPARKFYRVNFTKAMSALSS